jgi:hypothetical protein
MEQLELIDAVRLFAWVEYLHAPLMEERGAEGEPEQKAADESKPELKH